MELKIIKNQTEYKEALIETEHLISLDPKPGTPEAEHLDVLSLLVEKYEKDQFPIETPDPIEAIRFRMEEQNLIQRDLIPYIGSKSKVSEILSGKRSLTVPMIRALHEGLEIPLEVLLQKSKNGIERYPSIEYDKFPFREMIKRGWIMAKTKEILDNPEEIIKAFFKPLGGTDEITVFCRRTLVERTGRDMDKHALLVWTARVIMVANDLGISIPFKIKTITNDFMIEIARLSRSEDGPLLAKKLLEEHGIALIVEPHLPRTSLDGGSMLTPNGMPVIGMTLRYDRIDNFWFTLMHELVHIAKHIKNINDAFIDDLDSESGKDPREREADRIAGEIFIPRRIWKRTDAYRQRTVEAVLKLSDQLKIHPAIVAGRIRHDAKNYNILHQLVGRGKVRKLFSEINWS